jgi:hypothetical protein
MAQKEDRFSLRRRGRCSEKRFLFMPEAGCGASVTS